MALIIKTVEVTKEIDDVMVLLVNAVKNRKNGENLSNLMGDLASAISGIEDIDNELEESRKIALATIGSRFGELVDAFLAPSSQG